MANNGAEVKVIAERAHFHRPSISARTRDGALSRLPCPRSCRNWHIILKISKKRKTRDFAQKREFQRIRHLDDAVASELDKLRYDLQESIERTVRIQQAFVKKLNKQALHSNRIKHIVQLIGEVPFHCDLQRKIVDVKITEIIDSKAKEEEKKKEEKRKERKHAECNLVDVFICNTESSTQDNCIIDSGSTHSILSSERYFESIDY